MEPTGTRLGSERRLDASRWERASERVTSIKCLATIANAQDRYAATRLQLDPFRSLSPWFLCRLDAMFFSGIPCPFSESRSPRTSAVGAISSMSTGPWTALEPPDTQERFLKARYQLVLVGLKGSKPNLGPFLFSLRHTIWDVHTGHLWVFGHVCSIIEPICFNPRVIQTHRSSYLISLHGASF